MFAFFESAIAALRTETIGATQTGAAHRIARAAIEFWIATYFFAIILAAPTLVTLQSRTTSRLRGFVGLSIRIRRAALRAERRAFFHRRHRRTAIAILRICHASVEALEEIDETPDLRREAAVHGHARRHADAHCQDANDHDDDRFLQMPR